MLNGNNEAGLRVCNWIWNNGSYCSLHPVSDLHTFRYGCLIQKQNVPTIGQYDNIIICLDSVISFYILLLPILLKVSNHISTSGSLPINENRNYQQKYQSDALNYYISNFYIVSYQYSLQEQCQLILLAFKILHIWFRILLRDDYFPNKI